NAILEAPLRVCPRGRRKRPRSGASHHGIPKQSLGTRWKEQDQFHIRLQLFTNLVPKLRLGTQFSKLRFGSVPAAAGSGREAELPTTAFPSRAWERGGKSVSQNAP